MIIKKNERIKEREYSKTLIRLTMIDSLVNLNEFFLDTSINNFSNYKLYVNNNLLTLL